ncbi:membrane protein of ER body-like protein isoform X1 [Bidens hawaiensis]|uniref:membrane protein of ER body-like protein isoform X1 n=1 Tax=Bidens hawaiensis TaxID=980011 RepID=UPI00404B9D07
MESTEVQHEHPWDQEELDEGLVARTKNLNQTTNNADSVAVTNGKHHHQQDEVEYEDEEEEVKDFIIQPPDDMKVGEDEKKKEFCVYYDTDKGLWKCRICPWDNQGRACLTLHNQHPRWHSRMLTNVKTIYETKGTVKTDEPENTDITINNQENGNVVHTVMIKQNGEHQKHEISSESDKSSPSYIANKTEITEIDEITEYDVETVINKQDTHDLFCPNCNSCITKRVILRKRKHRVPGPAEDGKRIKPQTPVSSESNVVLDDTRLDDDVQVQPPISNEYDHQSEPDVFRCLSCFSIFMPTGNGFKLFHAFRNKNNEEKNELLQKDMPVKKSWFSNFFRSEKVEHSVTDLNDSGAVQSLDPENNIIEVSSVSSNVNLSMQEANLHTSNGTTDLENNQLQSDLATTQINGKMTTDSTFTDTTEQLLTSYHIEKESNNKSEYPGMFVVKPLLTNSVEPTDNSTSILQHDGLKLLVPPNVGTLIIDNSQMNQELDVTVQTNSSDVMHEASQHIVQNNVEIHLEEPLKVSKDLLIYDQHVNLLENVNNIERIKDDTIITIESKQRDASTFQTPPDTLGVTGTPAVQQAVECGSTATVTGGGRSVDIIKSIVYGGLIELITSLSVVSSAAGGDAATLNVLALGLANIFGGLFVICHDLWDLKNERTRKTEDRYQQLLGQRADFPLHMTVSLLSYLVFGFLPPVIYGFSFHDKDLKLLTVAAASIVCIMILAAGKAYVQRPPMSYFKTISYYVVFGFMVSGVSYLVGGLIVKLLEKMDVFQDGSFENLRVYGASSNSELAIF